MDSKRISIAITIITSLVLILSISGIVTPSRYDQTISETNGSQTISGRVEGDIGIFGNGKLVYDLIFQNGTDPQEFQTITYEFESEDVEDYPLNISYIILFSWLGVLLFSFIGMAGYANKVSRGTSLIFNLISVLAIIRFNFIVDSAYFPGLPGNAVPNTFQIFVLILFCGINTLFSFLDLYKGE